MTFFPPLICVLCESRNTRARTEMNIRVKILNVSNAKKKKKIKESKKNIQKNILFQHFFLFYNTAIKTTQTKP